MEPIISMRGMTKVFPGVIANDHIDLDVYPGQVHALLGENGAGKSTLMNILSGLYKPDSGTMMIRGKEVRFFAPRDAIAQGIGMIHQHFKLVDAFTVAENIILGDARNPFILGKKSMSEKIRKLSERYNIEVDPSAVVGRLSVGEQQRVEILKALYRDAGILVLDEPTAVLTPQESAQLFDTLREMALQGCTIIIITHKLTEVVDIAARVSVMRRGKIIGTVEGNDINYAALSAMMMGEAKAAENKADTDRRMGETMLEVENLVVSVGGLPALDDVSFSLRAGEILGVAGVAGNGQRELGEALAGLKPSHAGRILLNHRDITGLSPRARLNAGVSFVPEDRLGTGLIGNMDAVDNMMLRDYYRSKGIFLRYKEAKKRTEDAVKEYDISMASLQAPVRLMSGGNLQKLLLAREIRLNPKVIILSYPVRGLDMAATEHIYRLMVEQRDSGCAVLFISEDLDALLRFSDRIMVLYRGRINGLVPRKEAKITDIGMMMMGTSRQKEAAYEIYSHF
ncbi:MAG: ABC transporter ATP-binding protein [Christensenellales bacterium]|jgi:ABC-type uncharacterized transport system ATPase subunit